MEELYNLGINDDNIKKMIEANPELVSISKEEINIKVDILKNIGCSYNQILNIISSNSMYLNQTNDKINKLIKYLNILGFKYLNILFDANPYILNLDIYEIRNYIDKEENNGMNIEDIIDNLDSNPYIFNEM